MAKVCAWSSGNPGRDFGISPWKYLTPSLKKIRKIMLYSITLNFA